LSGGSARKRAKAVASAFVETTRTTTFPSAHTAVRSDTLDDEAMGKMVLDVGTEHDPPLLAINHESTPVLFA
jgi:hypothetical protein